MDLNISDKVAIITGGSRGIGRAIALQLAKNGCHIALCARTASNLEETVAKLQQLGIKAHGFTADVQKPEQIESFVTSSFEALGQIDFLIANTGGVFGKGLLESTPEDWQKTFELNLFHSVNAIRACVPYMQKRGSGSILLVASISGSKPAPKAQYGCAKAAQIYLASSLAWELREYRIRVNAISPGSTIFPGGGWDLFRESNPELFKEFESRDFPWGRLATVEEIAEVAAFILSDRAHWINGANIPIDGAQGRPSVLGY